MTSVRPLDRETVRPETYLMMAYRTEWRKTGALSWKMRYRKSRKIGLSMRAMGLAGWSRPSVPTTTRCNKTPCDEIRRSAANR